MSGADGRALRPELHWERIPCGPGQVYVARRQPTAELIVDDDPGVVVLETHDASLAAQVAWPLWCDEQLPRLPAPRRAWWRWERAAAAGQQHCDRMWWPATPCAPSAIPVVFYPFKP